MKYLQARCNLLTSPTIFDTTGSSPPEYSSAEESYSQEQNNTSTPQRVNGRVRSAWSDYDSGELPLACTFVCRYVWGGERGGVGHVEGILGCTPVS